LARTNLKSLLAILGWADVPDVQTLEDRLGYQTIGSIEFDLSRIYDDLSDVYGYSENMDKRIRPSPTIDSIFWKTGGALCPAGKSIWDYLPYLDVAISSAHSTTNAKIDRKITYMDFWSEADDEIVLTITTDNHALPPLAVVGIPDGATLVRVVVILKIALIRDTSGSNNAINGIASLGVDSDYAFGSVATAIIIPDNGWEVIVANSKDRAGDVMIGTYDVKSEITGNGTFYAQLRNIACDGNNLKLKDVCWGVRIYFY